MDNGLAITPPMGWRSANYFGKAVSQDLMESIMTAMVSRKRSVRGEPASLLDLGYRDVGLDDSWQLCDSGPTYPDIFKHEVQQKTKYSHQTGSPGKPPLGQGQTASKKPKEKSSKAPLEPESSPNRLKAKSSKAPQERESLPPRNPRQGQAKSSKAPLESAQEKSRKASGEEKSSKASLEPEPPRKRLKVKSSGPPPEADPPPKKERKLKVRSKSVQSEGETESEGKTESKAGKKAERHGKARRAAGGPARGAPAAEKAEVPEGVPAEGAEAQLQWHFCAPQEDTCYCRGSVRWGDAGTWTVVQQDTGSIRGLQCSTEKLGDPLPGVTTKHCECQDSRVEQSALLDGDEADEEVDGETGDGVDNGMEDSRVKQSALLDGDEADEEVDDETGDGVDNGMEVRTHRFHDNNGWPLINTKKFFDMRAMTAKAHQMKLTMGFYLNNCICKENVLSTYSMYTHDVDTVVDLGFDGVKLDNCGTQRDLALYEDLFNESGHAVLIENSHRGKTVPTDVWCPWNMYRTSQDIIATYGSMVRNLQTVLKFANHGLSRPGCWAYPDVLEIGCQGGVHGDFDKGMTFMESRSHFGAWCIVSSPLILSMDIRDDTVMSKFWPIISNTEAIAINQAWYGHSGSVFKQSAQKVPLEGLEGSPEDGVHGDDHVPAYQYFHKPIAKSKVAVLLMNHAGKSQSLTLAFSEVPELGGTKCTVRDVWQQIELGTFDLGITVELPSHDCTFLVLTC